MVDPGFFAAPDNANGVGGPTYPPATHTRYRWGLGFQAGIYYQDDGPWSFGASVKSPQWLETFEYNSHDEVGAPRNLALNVDYPLIVSIGTGFRGIERWLFAVDVRYIDYDNTQGFGQRAAFNPDGSASGLGWKSVFSVASGAQYQINDRLSARIGYLYNQNPIPDSATFFNILSSPIYEHAIFLGGSYHLTQSLALTFSYLHAFQNSISGPYETPRG